VELKQLEFVEIIQLQEQQDVETTQEHNVKQIVEEHLHLNLNQEIIVIVELKQ
jgi:CRISPR/Cas system CSM-associated protein Csm4 (group 5 of RAMP superfamily)